MVKINNVIPMDFAFRFALDNSALQIHFVLSQNFVKMIKIGEVSPHDLITSINLVLAKFVTDHIPVWNLVI